MWQLILDHMLSLLVVIVTPVLISMLSKFLKSRNIPIQQEVMEKVVTDAIHFAEGAGHAALQKGAPMEGHEKLEKALSYVEGESKRLGIDAAASDALEKLVEAKLVKLKSDGSIPATEPAPSVTLKTPDPSAVAEVILSGIEKSKDQS